MSKFMKYTTGLLFTINFITINGLATTYDFDNITTKNFLLAFIILGIVDFIIYKLLNFIDHKVWNIITKDILRTMFK